MIMCEDFCRHLKNKVDRTNTSEKIPFNRVISVLSRACSTLSRESSSCGCWCGCACCDLREASCCDKGDGSGWWKGQVWSLSSPSLPVASLTVISSEGALHSHLEGESNHDFILSVASLGDWKYASILSICIYVFRFMNLLRADERLW